MTMKKTCSECKGKMKRLETETSEGIGYTYFKCQACGDEIVDKEQLQALAEHYRTLKRYHAKLSKWGLSLGLRIPKDLVKQYHFKEDKEIIIIPEKDGLKLVV